MITQTRSLASLCPALLLALAATPLTAADPANSPAAAPSASVALEWLRFGNERHAAGKYVHWHQSPERRRDTAHQERPHAVVITCSDSRVPPELVFDQGLGDLYVVRIPGPAVGPTELAGIEHALRQLGAPLVVVLGHQRCDIVRTAVQGGPMPGQLGAIVASLSPAVARVQGMAGDPVDHAARMNVEVMTEKIRESEPVIAPLVRGRKVTVLGAYYRLDSGVVEWTRSEPLSQH